MPVELAYIATSVAAQLAKGLIDEHVKDKTAQGLADLGVDLLKDPAKLVRNKTDADHFKTIVRDVARELGTVVNEARKDLAPGSVDQIVISVARATVKADLSANALLKADLNAAVIRTALFFGG